MPVVKVTPGTVPYCYSSEQERYLAYLNNTLWSIPEPELGVSVIADTVEPTNDAAGNIYAQVESSGALVNAFAFHTTLNAWVRRHPYEAGSPVRLMWTGDLTALQNFDGGDTDTPGQAAGPMWEEDTDMADVFPLGVGTTIATAGDKADVFTVTTPAAPQAVGVYWIKRTARIYYKAP